eukprot:TRINITY_DN55192_c0_g1_i1.p1 TRINITY_DN55192_c0_g1~~TRINITY_DN55192_c0_g1_i1.p1  ORF type:complete len:108 (-),score=39.20 TRINITY_DN55192_c0_g1_i1:49-372(-)
MEFYSKGQRIDITGVSTMKFHNGREWVDASETELSWVEGEFQNVRVHIPDIHDVIAYKKQLGRAVDLQDVEELERVVAQAVSYTHLRAHETPEHLVCRLLLEKKKTN